MSAPSVARPRCDRLSARQLRWRLGNAGGCLPAGDGCRRTSTGRLSCRSRGQWTSTIAALSARHPAGRTLRRRWRDVLPLGGGAGGGALPGRPDPGELRPCARPRRQRAGGGRCPPPEMGPALRGGAARRAGPAGRGVDGPRGVALRRGVRPGRGRLGTGAAARCGGATAEGVATCGGVSCPSAADVEMLLAGWVGERRSGRRFSPSLRGRHPVAGHRGRLDGRAAGIKGGRYDGMISRPRSCASTAASDFYDRTRDIARAADWLLGHAKPSGTTDRYLRATPTTRRAAGPAGTRCLRGNLASTRIRSVTVIRRT